MTPCVFMYVHVYGGQRTTYVGVFRNTIHFMKVWVAHCFWNTAVSLGWLTTMFYVGSEGLNSGPGASKASTLVTEPALSTY